MTIRAYKRMMIKDVAQILGMHYTSVKTFVQGYTFDKWIIRGSHPLQIKSSIEFWEEMRFFLEGRLKNGQRKKNIMLRCMRYIAKLYREERLAKKAIAG